MLYNAKFKNEVHAVHISFPRKSIQDYSILFCEPVIMAIANESDVCNAVRVEYNAFSTIIQTFAPLSFRFADNNYYNLIFKRTYISIADSDGGDAD